MSAGAYILHTSSLSTIAGTGEEEQEASHLHLLDPFAPLLDTLPSSLRLCLDKYPSTVPWGRTHAARQNKQQAAEPSSSSAATSSSRPRKRARTRRRETQQTDVYEELIERAAQRLKEHAQANLGALDWWENTALASGRVRFSYEGEHISTEHSGIEWAILEREHDDLLVGAQVIKQKSPALSVNSQQSLLLGLTEQDRKGRCLGGPTGTISDEATFHRITAPVETIFHRLRLNDAATSCYITIEPSTGEAAESSQLQSGSQNLETSQAATCVPATLPSQSPVLEKLNELWLPPHSGFLITDLLRSQLEVPPGWSSLQTFLTEQHGVDLLLLDPPYPNKSAERLASNKGRTRPRSGMDSSSSATAPASTSKVRANAAYHTVSDIYDLWALKLPVRAALEAGGPGRKTVVGVWVTNNPKCKRFVLEKLFPAWGVEQCGEWAWLKITAAERRRREGAEQGVEQSGQDGREPKSIPTGGEPIVDLNNPENRKPYELLILGRYDDQPSTNADPDTPAIGLRGLPAQDKERDETGQSTDEKWTWPEVPLPAPKVFASVPLGHSRKPDVFELLRAYLPIPTRSHQNVVGSSNAPQRGPVVLELFARNLRPGPQSDNGNENGQGPDTAPLGAQDDSGRKASGEQDHTPNNPGPDSNSKSHPNLDASAKESDSERERDESGNGPKQRGWWISVGNEAPKFNELGVGYEYCAR